MFTIRCYICRAAERAGRPPHVTRVLPSFWFGRRRITICASCAAFARVVARLETV